MAKKGFSILSTLNSQSVPDGDRAANEFAVEMISLDEIKPNAENFYNTEDIEALAADIKQNGLMHNIVVSERGQQDGLYTIISGERRYRAFALLRERGNEGYDTIPATVDAETNPLLIKLKLISANATARVLSDYEKAEQAAEIERIVKQLKQEGVDLPGRAREIAAQALGVSTAQAGRLTKIANDLVPEVKDKFAAGDIGVTEAYDVATLPPEEQMHAVEARAEKSDYAKPSFVSQADIDAVLTRGGGYYQGKTMLAKVYAQSPTTKDAIKALKQAYGTGGQSFSYANGLRGKVGYSPEGIVFGLWGSDEKVKVSWTTAHKRMLELIAEGKFILPDASDEPAPEFMGKKLNVPYEEAQPAPKRQEQEPDTATTAHPITRLVPWAEGFDEELTSAATCLDSWNELSCHPAEFKLIKSLVIQEAAMRKRRAQ